MAMMAEVQKFSSQLTLDEVHESSTKELHAGLGGYRYDSPEGRERVKAHRQALWSWLMSIGSHMFKEGVNLTKISMPVVLFEPRSFLERLTGNWEYLDLLTAAAKCTDPADRMKYVVAFAVAGLCRQVSFDKPFNPILGETYQAQFPNGVQVFAEQISHHPPISSWQLLEPSGKFHFYGNGNWSASARGNSVKGRQSGVNCIEFASDGACIRYELPGLTVKGVMWGDRAIHYGGQMKFVDDKNGLICEVEVDPAAPASLFGSWFKSSAKEHKPDQVRGELMRGSSVLDTCSGNWLSHVEWEKGVEGGKLHRLWDCQLSPLSIAQEVPQALASDSRHREDLVQLRSGDQVKSQEYKQALEQVQRRDRKLRQEGGGYGG